MPSPVQTERSVKGHIPCDLCAGSLKPGQLWLSGADYLQCPQCFGTCKVEIIVTKAQRNTKTVFMAGYKPHVEVNWNLRSLISGSPIPGNIEIPRRTA